MWKRLAALEGWQRASLISGTLSFVFFAFVELPSHFLGKQPITTDTLFTDVAFVVGLYLLPLGVWAYWIVPRPRFQLGHIRAACEMFEALSITLEMLPQSIAFLASLLRKGWLALRER
jgi:hypothetical protein